MSDISKIFVAIAAEFTGKPAFKQAETATARLQKSVVNLGRSIGLTFGTAAIVNYSKRAVQAAAADAKAQALLANQLKNVGYAMADVQVESFIQNMEKTTGVLDDELRPAFSRLLVATGSVAKSQELMAVAFDTAKARGMQVEDVAKTLALAWNGNTKGLKNLGLGYSAAELKTVTFLQVQNDLVDLYQGAGKAALDTYAGSVDKLRVSFANASETIGGAFIDSFKMLGGQEGIGGAQSGIQTMADTIANAITGVGYLINALMKFKAIIIPIGIAFAAAFLPVTTAIVAAVAAFALIGKIIKDKNKVGTPGQSPGERAKIDKENAKIAKDAARIAKQQTQALTQNTKALKTKTAAEQALDKLKEIFDPQNAQLAAAAAAATDDETKARIKALQTINNNDEAQAKLALSALYTSGALDGLSSALLETIRKILGIQIPTSFGALYKLTPEASFEADRTAIGNAALAAIAALPYDQLNSMDADRSRIGASSVSVYINPAVAGLLDVTQNASASGISPTVNRNASSYIA